MLSEKLNEGLVDVQRAFWNLGATGDGLEHARKAQDYLQMVDAVRRTKACVDAVNRSITKFETISQTYCNENPGIIPIQKASKEKH